MNEESVRAALIGAFIGDPMSAHALELRSCGVEVAWRRIQAGHPSVPEPLRRRLLACDPERFLAAGVASGARIVVPGDPEWPTSLDDLGVLAPWALWVRGPGLQALRDTRAVSIVGARSCTSYGERAAAEIAVGLAHHSLPVVSGGAYGIDAAAHRGALVGDGVTIAVLASGIDVPYPAANATLFDRVCERGALITEAAPGAHPTRPAFLVRNRLIAALGYGTVVVEARLRSGSYSTFAHARALHRVLMAVPGPVTSPESAGTHALIREEGAQLVTGSNDVLALIAALGSVEIQDAVAPATEWDSLDAREREVHELLPARGGVSCEALLLRTHTITSVATLLGALSSLAQRGLVAEDIDGRWRRIRRLRGAEA